jgi:phosphonate transport system substrate-binding protein
MTIPLCFRELRNFYFESNMISRRLLLTQSLLLLAGCSSAGSGKQSLSRLTIGAVAYGEGVRSVDQYQRFIQYLEGQTKTLIELEPAYNEVKALEQIRGKVWSLVFAPPGLAAIAIAKAQYLPLFPLQGVSNLSSVLVVRRDSPIKKLADANGKIIALGQPGSATGYYVPLYELYGTAPSEIRTAPTPKTVLEWLAKEEVEIGALAKDEFDRFRMEFNQTPFRVLLASRRIPAGAVLISPAIDRNQQEVIQKAMREALPAIAQEVGYIPNAAPPNYKDLIAFIDKVKPIEAQLGAKPAVLFQSDQPKKTTY